MFEEAGCLLKSETSAETVPLPDHSSDDCRSGADDARQVGILRQDYAGRAGSAKRRGYGYRMSWQVQDLSGRPDGKEKEVAIVILAGRCFHRLPDPGSDITRHGYKCWGHKVTDLPPWFPLKRRRKRR